MLAAIRRSQREDSRPQTPVGQFQTMRHHDNYRRRPRRDRATQRTDQVRLPVAHIATPVNSLCSALEEIEERSRVLRGKGKVARFVGKGRDSGEVAKLVERLRDAIVRYQVGEARFVPPNTTYTAGQVSQQQAIYHQITCLTVRIFRLVFVFCTDGRSWYQVFFQRCLGAP